MSENINIEREQHNITISEPMRDYHLPIASETVLGGIKVGNNLTIEEDGTLNAEATEYVLPVATASTLGGVKVGNNLAINDGVLTAAVDSVLSGSSTNPVQNSVITNTINSTNSDIAALDTRLDTAEDNITGNAENITTLSGNLSTLSNTVDTLSGTVTSQGNTIDGLTSTVGGFTSDISDLQERMTTAEGSIEDLIQGSNEMGSDISVLKTSTNTTVEYNELLPVATWTDGDITLRRRGNIGFLFINLEGNFLLGANTSTTIYTFQTESNIPDFKTSASVLTDVGNIVLSVDDQGVVELTNPSASALTISKVYGNVPLVY